MTAVRVVSLSDDGILESESLKSDEEIKCDEENGMKRREKR